jgi:hypothetical protein
MTLESPTFCANHPDREATLRCNKCGKPICVKCAKRMATGYRCPECISQQQQVFETARWYDFLIAGGVAFVLSVLAGALITNLGWFIFFLSPLAGGGIAQVVTFAVRKRRSKYLPWIAAGGAALGGIALCILPTIFILGAMVFGGRGELGGVALSGLLGILWPLLYTGLCATTVFYSLRGIRIN